MRSERGLALLTFLPLFALGLIALTGTWKVVEQSHQRIAMQSRADLCALRLVEARRRFARELEKGNQVIGITTLAVSMSRGLKLLGGPAGALVGTLGEAALVKLNQATARVQEARLLWAQGKEWSLRYCSPTPFSRGPAFCRAEPTLSSALARAKAPFPDLQGKLEFRSELLLSARCGGLQGPGTRMRLFRSASQLVDVYEQ